MSKLSTPKRRRNVAARGEDTPGGLELQNPPEQRATPACHETSYAVADATPANLTTPLNLRTPLHGNGSTPLSGVKRRETVYTRLNAALFGSPHPDNRERASGNSIRRRGATVVGIDGNLTTGMELRTRRNPPAMRTTVGDGTLHEEEVEAEEQHDGNLIGEEDGNTKDRVKRAAELTKSPEIPAEEASSRGAVLKGKRRRRQCGGQEAGDDRMSSRDEEEELHLGFTQKRQRKRFEIDDVMAKGRFNETFQTFPTSDLLQEVHSAASHHYEETAEHMFRSLDGSALIAVGILSQELLREFCRPWV